MKLSPQAKAKFNALLHPRYPKGHPSAGKFMAKGGADYKAAVSKALKNRPTQQGKAIPLSKLGGDFNAKIDKASPEKLKAISARNIDVSKTLLKVKIGSEDALLKYDRVAKILGKDAADKALRQTLKERVSAKPQATLEKQKQKEKNRREWARAYEIDNYTYYNEKLGKAISRNKKTKERYTSRVANPTNEYALTGEGIYFADLTTEGTPKTKILSPSEYAALNVIGVKYSIDKGRPANADYVNGLFTDTKDSTRSVLSGLASKGLLLKPVGKSVKYTPDPLPSTTPKGALYALTKKGRDITDNEDPVGLSMHQYGILLAASHNKITGIGALQNELDAKPEHIQAAFDFLQKEGLVKQITGTISKTSAKPKSVLKK